MFMAYIVMAYIVTAYIVMDYVVMAHTERFIHDDPGRTLESHELPRSATFFCRNNSNIDQVRT